jgi:hypothetical protein
MKEYVKIVQIKKLKMKLTFSLDVQNLVGREIIFSIPYQLKLKFLPIYLIKINYYVRNLQMDFIYSYVFTNVRYFSNLKLVFKNKYVVSFPSFNDSHHASLSELGRHPLHYDIVKSLLKYCYRLENLTTEFPLALLKDAFLCSKNLHFRRSASWY